MIPLRTDSRLRATPWMNWGIIALNIAAFLVGPSHRFGHFLDTAMKLFARLTLDEQG